MYKKMDLSRKRKSESSQTPPSSKQRLENLVLIRSLKCSKCSKDYCVEAISNLKAECYECSIKPTTDISGYPFEMIGDEKQLAQNFHCPICLLIMRDTTELPCNHLMCAGCLIKNEARLPTLRYNMAWCTRNFLLEIFSNFLSAQKIQV